MLAVGLGVATRYGLCYLRVRAQAHTLGMVLAVAVPAHIGVCPSTNRLVTAYINNMRCW